MTVNGIFFNYSHTNKYGHHIYLVSLKYIADIVMVKQVGQHQFQVFMDESDDYEEFTSIEAVTQYLWSCEEGNVPW